ncbi:MAG: CaiB/BaiF CoA transferase family protein [Gammaproteobacteria bacterium]
MMTVQDSLPFPLAGMKVLDLTRALSGPFATRILSDLGADVVKVEPPDGDMTRAYGSRIGGLASHFTQHNAGKRDICIDMKAAGAVDLVLALADVADVVVENFRPGVMARLGLDWTTLHARNPRLCMLSISGFGQEGPERERAAYAPVLHAECGLIDRFAELGKHHAVDFPASSADTTAAVHGVIGLLAALLMAARTGQGQHIDLAMINSQFYHDDFLSMVLSGDTPPAGSGEVWTVAGGRIVVATTFSYLWKKVSRHGGLADPGDEDGRRAALATYFASFPTWASVTAMLDSLNLAWGRVRPWREAVHTNPSVGPREVIAQIDDRIGGTRPTTQAPYRFSDARATVRGPAPYRGEHNAAVLRDWLGYDAERIQSLCRTGVLSAQEEDAQT